MTHTPGPWIYDDKYVQVLDDDDNEIYIAGICGPFTDWVRANAALIAAAPDLLDAAEAGLDALLVDGVHGGADSEPECPQCAAIVTLLTAIKKAKGLS